MKKLSKLQINAEKLLKNEELLTLRGGYDYGYCACKDSYNNTICGTWVQFCYDCRLWCEIACPSSVASICAGGQE